MFLVLGLNPGLTHTEHAHYYWVATQPLKLSLCAQNEVTASPGPTEEPGKY